MFPRSLVMELSIERMPGETALYDVVLRSNNGAVRLHSFGTLFAAEDYVSLVAPVLERKATLT